MPEIRTPRPAEVHSESAIHPSSPSASELKEQAPVYDAGSLGSNVITHRLARRGTLPPRAAICAILLKAGAGSRLACRAGHGAEIIVTKIEVMLTTTGAASLGASRCGPRR